MTTTTLDSDEKVLLDTDMDFLLPNHSTGNKQSSNGFNSKQNAFHDYMTDESAKLVSE